jgi:hypothetical protein
MRSDSTLIWLSIGQCTIQTTTGACVVEAKTMTAEPYQYQRNSVLAATTYQRIMDTLLLYLAMAEPVIRYIEYSCQIAESGLVAHAYGMWWYSRC